jgi:hypothetical protein
MIKPWFLTEGNLLLYSSNLLLGFPTGRSFTLSTNAIKFSSTFNTAPSHNNEIKMIRRGHYSSNNFQDSNKRKSTEKKTLGYLPRVLFFNAFELGAESAN